MTPAEISASLKRCGVPASQDKQEMAALQILVADLTRQVALLAMSAKELTAAANEMVARSRDYDSR
jgi:hypothetical protein